MCPAVAHHDKQPESLGLLLGQVRGELVRALEQELAAQGVELRFSQVLALKHLQRLGPMSAGELARSLGHDGGATTRLLDQLEDKGYLKRKPHAQDRRALRIELTTPGRAICRRFAGCSERVLDAAQQTLTPAERRHLRDYLQRVLAALRQTH